MATKELFFWGLAAAALQLSGCVGEIGGDPSSEDAPDQAVVELPLVAHPHPFVMGANEWIDDLHDYGQFRALGAEAGPRLCHVYTYWNVARHDPGGSPDETHQLAGLVHWMEKAEALCDEVLVTFQGPQREGPVSPPTAKEFEEGFLAFEQATTAGKPLAHWHGKLAFTAWNEPNNPAGSGNGLREHLPPELAARYYLAIRKHCKPSAGCRVAAGDFATNGETAKDIEWNCANDADPADSEKHCASPSSMNKTNEPPSYLDRYKQAIAVHATQYGLPKGFRPEIFAYHPWHDVNGYLDSEARCDNYEHCTTRRLLKSLSGSWGHAAIWDTEIGVGMQNDSAPDEHRQACGAAFLVRLTDLSPRFSRVYYMRFAGGNGPLLTGGALRPAGKVLAERATSAKGAACADTGIAMESYANPILPMFHLGASSAQLPESVRTEGCPHSR